MTFFGDPLIIIIIVCWYYIAAFWSSFCHGSMTGTLLFSLFFESGISSHFYLQSLNSLFLSIFKYNFALWISAQGDELQVKVNKLSSTKTQLPYDYYFLEYCKPKKIMNSAENLGEVLRGDRIENSVYAVSAHQLFRLRPVNM